MDPSLEMTMTGILKDSLISVFRVSCLDIHFFSFQRNFQIHLLNSASPQGRHIHKSNTYLHILYIVIGITLNGFIIWGLIDFSMKYNLPVVKYGVSSLYLSEAFCFLMSSCESHVFLAVFAHSILLE